MDVFLATLFIVVCVLLIVVVLLQKGRGGGLSGAFGGMGSAAFGTRTGDVFTWVTIVLTALFFLLAVGMGLYFKPPMQQVAMPTFDQTGHPISSEISVNISVSGDKQGTAIYYTLDGAAPNRDTKVSPGSLQYKKEAVVVQPGQVLKAIAYRPGQLPSNVAEAAFPNEKTSTSQRGEELEVLPTTTTRATSKPAAKAAAPAVSPAPASMPSGAAASMPG